MLILFGVAITNFRRRNQHVHELTLPRFRHSRLPVRENRVWGRCGDVHDRATTRIVSLPALRVGRRAPPGGERSPLPHRADRSQAGLHRPARSPGGVPPVQGRAAGAGRFCRPARQLHPELQAVCLGVVPAHDDPGCRDALGHQLGRDQGDPEGGPPAAVRQGEAQAPAADRHRRDFHGQGAPLPDGRLGPGERGGGLRRRGKRRGCLEGLLDSASPLAGQDRGRGHGHVARRTSTP